MSTETAPLTISWPISSNGTGAISCARASTASPTTSTSGTGAGLLDPAPGRSHRLRVPPPQPEPFTTIAWRMAHVIVGVLAVRTHSHFDGPPADYESWNYAADAATALRQLDDAYANWMAGVQGLSAPISRRRSVQPRDRAPTGP